MGVDDSKKLLKKREEFYEEIKKRLWPTVSAVIDNETVDRINILEATKAAMKEALRQLERNLRKA